MNRLFLLFTFGLFLQSRAQTATDIIPYRKDSLWGYANEAGKVVIAPQFEMAAYFNEDGLAKVKTKKGYQLVDKKGKLQTAIYSDLGGTAEGLRVAANDQKQWGYIDAKGKWIIAPTYASAGYFKKGIAIVKVKDHYGLLGRNGTLVIDTGWLSITPIDDSKYYLVKVKKSKPANLFDDYLVMNENGKILRKFTNHESVKPGIVFANVVTVLAKENKVRDQYTSLMDTSGKSLPDIWDMKFRNGERVMIKTKDGWGVINKLGHWTLKPALNREAAGLANNNPLFRSSGKYVLYDSMGKPAIDNYWFISSTVGHNNSYNMRRTATDGMVIRNISGELLDSCKSCSLMQALPDNLFKVSVADSSYIRTKTGQNIIGPFDYISPYSTGFVVLNYGRDSTGKKDYRTSSYGFYSITGEELLAPQYSLVSPSFIPGFLYVIDKANMPLGYMKISNRKKFWE